MNLRAVFPILILCCAALLHCGPSDKCSTTKDCFSGEVCASGTCVEGVNLNNANNTGTPNSSTTGPNGKPGGSNGTGTPNGTTGPNNGTTGNPNGTTGNPNGTTGSNNNTTTTPTGACVSDPFTAMCTSTSDGFYTYLTTNTGRGCQGVDDDFEGGTYEHVTSEFCPTETAHKYTTNLSSCRTRTFFVEITVTPLQACDPDDWDLKVQVQGATCDDPGNRMRCELLDDGVSKRVIARIDEEISITTPRIDIVPRIENMQFEYDLTLTVRE